MIDADGYRRIVHYTSSKETGFIANVEREAIKGYQAPQQAVKYEAAPVVKYQAAPVVKYESAPVIKYQAAPVVKYEAPVVKYQAPAIKYEAPVVKKISYEAPQQYKYVQAAAPKYESNNSEVKFSSPKANYNY